MMEHCRLCDTELPLTKDGYIVRHTITHREGGSVGHARAPLETGGLVGPVELRYDLVGTRCDGSEKRSREWKEAALAKKWRKHNERIANVPHDASVAYDAWAEGRPINVDKFVQLAATEYKRKFGALGLSEVKTYVTARSSGGDWKNHRMDVYCTFCRGLLMSRISTAANPGAFKKVQEHPIGCALLCLAGRREFMPPDHRGLIDEDRAFAE